MFLVGFQLEVCRHTASRYDHLNQIGHDRVSQYLWTAEYQPDGKDPIGPSAVAIQSKDKVYAPKSNTMLDYPAPRALDIDEIPGIVQLFATGARNSIEAGTRSASA